MNTTAAPTADARAEDRQRVQRDASTRGRNHRTAMAFLTALVSAYFIGPFWASIWLAAVFAWERVLPLITERYVTPFSKSHPERARWRGLTLSTSAASLYAIGYIPSWLTGHPGAAYFAALWIACAMIHTLVYNGNDKLSFWATISPALAGTVIVPFFIYGGEYLLILVLIAAAGRILYTTYTAQNDRLALLASVQQNRAERRAAEEANKAKSQFLATMSHELRTPLNAVIGYAEILEEDLTADGKEQGASDAGRIVAAARNLLVLINEVLDLSKIEAGKMDIVLGPFDPAEAAAEVVETCRHIAEQNQSQIEVMLDPSIGIVVSDQARLRQCLLNLVSNASKFTTEGLITVRGVSEEQGGVEFLRFDVTDTGCGIAPDQAARLFQPFVQADGSFTRKVGGTGLGLVITRKLAQLMGGDVTFSSEIGKGSTFTLRIAVTRVHVSTVMTNSSGAPVVVIEDEAASRDLICRALARLPFAVRCAPTAEDGVALARALRPALIVLDIHLPDRSGWELLAEFSADPIFADTPVLVVSIDDDRARALALGACDHIVKPFDRDRLAAAAMLYARLPSGADEEPEKAAVSETIWDDAAVA